MGTEKRTIRQLVDRAVQLAGRCRSAGYREAERLVTRFACTGAPEDLWAAHAALYGARDGLRIAAEPSTPEPSTLELLDALADDVVELLGSR